MCVFYNSHFEINLRGRCAFFIYSHFEINLRGAHVAGTDRVSSRKIFLGGKLPAQLIVA